MNAVLNSLALLSELGADTTLVNIDYDWMYLDPNVLLWADRIYVPEHFIKNIPDFRLDVGFQQSNEVLQRSLEQAWEMLVEAGVIVRVPITEVIREAAYFAHYAVENRLTQTVSGPLPNIGVDVSANLQWATPPDLLRIASGLAD